jgi:putative ABC transport system ATP-binding protein
VAKDRYGFRDAVGWMREIVGPDSAYIRLGLVYGVAISLLSLATPISVQLLINSVTNTALPAPLWTLAGVLFLLLLIVAGLSAARVYIMALFERRFFARVVAEITVRAVHAQNPFFADQKRGDLFNRYFDMVVVQKSVPSLVINAFTIILQSAVGLVVTSFYHPFFLAFNVILLLVLFLIWAVWARPSIGSAVALSHAKHDAARWLESVGGSNGFYKSSRHLNFAMERSERATANYVGRHRSYIRYTFAQTVSFYFLYAFSSAALLALGGNLILDNQLSIGQLVAAELILSGVFYGISQLGWYVDVFYELVASSEELSLLFSIPQEPHAATGREGPRDGAVTLSDVAVDGARFDFRLGSGEQLVTMADPLAARLLAQLLKRHVQPERGLMTIGGADLGALDMYLLRSEVMMLDRPTIVEVTIREYLTMAGPHATATAILDVLDAVGLQRRISSLPQGLDTPLASSGFPLSIAEVMALKLANALLVRPKVLVLSQLSDLLPPSCLTAALQILKQNGTTTLVITGRPEDIALDGWFWLGATAQRRCDSQAELRAVALAEEGGRAVPA